MNPLLPTLCLVLLAGCCTDCPMQLDGWEPTAYVDGVPIYSTITETETCAVSAVHTAFLNRYERRAERHVRGVFIVRDLDDRIPCRDDKDKPCTWRRHYGHIGGVAVVNDCGGRRFVFATNRWHLLDQFVRVYTHELGHAVLSLKHKGSREKDPFYKWERRMLSDYVFPRIEEECCE